MIYAQRVTTPEVAERILSEGRADLVAIARGLVADPEWANKSRSGQQHLIVPCVGCVQDCRTFNPPRCLNNARTGREDIWPEPATVPVLRKRRVVVIGGGPAGLEAAVVAAGRGHAVTVIEQNDELGGQVRLAANGPFREELLGVIRFRAEALARLSVEVRTGVEADVALLDRESADVVVLATGGAQRTAPQVPVDGTPVISSWDLLRGSDMCAEGGHAIVLDECGDWDAVSAAELLAQRGYATGIVTNAGAIGVRIPWESMSGVSDRLREASIRVWANARLSSVTGGVASIVIGDVAIEVPADLIVSSSGTVANDGLRTALVAAGHEVHLVGDCIAPRRITEAVVDGYRVGMSL